MARYVLLSAVLAVLCCASTDALACDEKCVGVYDMNGRLVGHGCQSGSDGENCSATVEECEIDYCGAPVAVLTGMGTQAELSRVCPAMGEAGEVPLGRAGEFPNSPAAPNAGGSPVLPRGNNG